MKKQYMVHGMHCVNCARSIEKSVTKNNEIKSARVNFATKELTVEANQIDDKSIIDSVAKAGYKAMADDDMSMMNMHDHPRYHGSKSSNHDMSDMDMIPSMNMPGMNHKVGASEVAVWNRRFIVAVALSIPLLIFMAAGFLPDNYFTGLIMPYMGIVSLVLATVSQIFLGASFYKSAWAGLRNGMLNMDSLIALGTTVAYVYSAVTYSDYTVSHNSLLVMGDSVHLYFETAVFLMTFVVFGKWLESRATAQTTAAIESLMRLKPKKTHLISGKATKEINIDAVKPGDLLLVKPGEQVPVDGEVLDGVTSIDESMVTGESLAVDKAKGDQIIGATINGTGSIKMKATKVGSDTVLSHIIRLVKEASGSKAPIEDLSDKISAWFIPAVVVISVVTFVVWFFWLHLDLSSSVMVSVSVLVIACPCALGLATPTAVTVGVGRSSQLGILIKGGEPLQKLSKIQAVVFDKTGTLTVGQPIVTDVIGLSQHSKSEVISLAASLESASEHSLARAVISESTRLNIDFDSVSQFKAVAGQGVEAVVDGTLYHFGNTKFLKNSSISIPESVKKLENEGKTVACLFNDKLLLGAVAISDKIKPGASQAISQLASRGITTYLLSGDNERSVQAMASQIGIKNIIANVSPDGKASEIGRLQKTGLRVAMVGDGINDAPALAKADVGLAMKTGTDVAIESGDVVLVDGSPLKVVESIELSRAVMTKIKQNLFFSLFYNSIGIPMAAGLFAFAGITMKPEIAGLAMALSSVSVVLNSLTLRLWQLGKRNLLSDMAPAVIAIVFTVLFILASH